MAQNDKLHIGDSQNSQWWGAKQGLFINSLASQYGYFETDLAYRNTINQNTKFTITAVAKGGVIFGNRFSGLFSGGIGMCFTAGNLFPATSAISLQYTWSIGSEKTNTFVGYIVNESPKMLNSCLSYDNIIAYNSPPNINAVNISKNRIINASKSLEFSPAGTYFIPISENIYPIDKQIIRLNLGTIGGGNQNFSGVVRDLRIYTRDLESKERTDNYHAMEATNRNDLFCEWKMAQPSDFYVYDNKLYARNTGSSGNTNEDGTGYDMELIGYLDNIPILNSIY